MAKFNQKIKTYLPTILGVLTIAGVVISVFNFYILATMAPLARDITVIQSEIKANEEAHQDFVTTETFTQLVTRIDHISSRVDSIYSIVANK